MPSTDKIGNMDKKNFIESISDLSAEQKAQLSRIKVPISDFIQILWKIHQSGIDLREISYLSEFLIAIKDRDHLNIEWLAAVKDYQEEMTAEAALSKLLEIYINLIYINGNKELSPSDLNRIISQLINIVSITTSISKSEQVKVENLCTNIKKIISGKDRQAIDTLGNIDIDISKVNYSIELVKSVVNRDFEEFNWLAAISPKKKNVSSKGMLKQALDIFENIIDVNQIENREELNVNRIVSQLTNINRLSQYVAEKEKNNIKYQIHRINNELLNPDYVKSDCFSQEGEDLILSRLFPFPKIGFFVDVGAHHPTRFSNTYLLYKRGWRGINIDPLPGSMEVFEKLRPEDINIEVAITANTEPGSNVKYVQFEEPAYNFIYKDNYDESMVEQINSRLVKIVDVPARCLDEIIEEHSSRFHKINLLNIDVELCEMEVLNGFSIHKYLPEVVVVEIKGLSLHAINDSLVCKYFIDNNYRLKSILFNSVIFELII